MENDASRYGYWDSANFNFHDAINRELWRQSPQLQREIQPPSELTQAGAVGAQQAMIEYDPNLVLPWVPDLVGQKAKGKNSVLVFGSAYAGFVAEYSSRKACLTLDDYRSAAANPNSVALFQEGFLEKVIIPDRDYYGRLASLLASQSIPATQTILSDLCPNSLLKRIINNNQCQDCSRQPSKDRASIYCKYVEHPTVRDWTWRRIMESGAERLIALGHLAEHGLLRLFLSHGARISCSGVTWNVSQGGYSSALCAILRVIDLKLG